MVKAVQYQGPITPKEAAEGMNAAALNARRLLADARLLFDAGRFPSACSLAILAIEEAGKVSLLRMILVTKDTTLLKKAWRSYRNHCAKNAQWIMPALVRAGARTANDLRPIYDMDSDHTSVLDQIKQLGFYTDTYKQGHWHRPDSGIDENLAREIIHSAGTLIPSRDTTEREMELWVQHVGPVWGTNAAIPAASLAWYKAMRDEGIAEYNLDDVAAFLGVANDLT